MRSHSHSNVNKPSQDLLGLTLHEISDPIDTQTVSCENNASEIEKKNDVLSNTAGMPKQQDLEAFQVGMLDSGTSCNTSKGN